MGKSEMWCPKDMGLMGVDVGLIFFLLDYDSVGKVKDALERIIASGMRLAEC
tara:strand:+ start:80 stop:235 length:156 start_codon:yes stop_codon:yes gene_type:complete